MSGAVSWMPWDLVLDEIIASGADNLFFFMPCCYKDDDLKSKDLANTSVKPRF